MARAPHSRYVQKALKSRSVSLNKSETVKGYQKFEVRALSTPETVYDDVLQTSFSFFVWAVSRAPRFEPIFDDFENFVHFPEISGNFPYIENIQRFGHHIHTMA